MISPAIKVGSNLFNKGKSVVENSNNALKKIILRRTKVKREKIAGSKLLERRRREREERDEKEQILETSKPKTTGGSFAGITSMAKSFLGGVLDFIGILIVGWMVTNLPTIIKMVEEFIARINLLVDSIKRFVQNIGKWLVGFKNLIVGGFQNILKFDFIDQSGKINKALQEMNAAVSGIEKAFNDAATAVGGDMGGVSAAGGGVLNASDIIADTPEEKAFIATVRELEGTGGSGGYNTVYGGAVVPKLTQMTLKELYDAIRLGGTDRLPDRLGGATIPFKKDQYNSSASGALQLMPETLRGLVERGQFKWSDTFSPETQNKMILALARQGGVKIENMNVSQMTKAGNIWASLTPRYGQTRRTADQSMAVYNQNLKEARGAGDGRQARSSSQSSAYQRAVMIGQSLEKQGYRAWQHPDFNINSGYTGSGKERVMRRSYNSYHNHGEALDYPLSHNTEEQLNTLAAYFRQNKSALGIAEVLWKTSGHYDHLHVSFKGGGAIDRNLANAPSLRGQQQRQQIIIIEEEEEASPVMIASSSGASQPIVIGDSLNSFMKKQLLLELAYT